MEKEKAHLFDKPENVRRLLIIFFSSVILLFVLDFFVHKHAHFPWETWPVFYAIFGLWPVWCWCLCPGLCCDPW